MSVVLDGLGWVDLNGASSNIKSFAMEVNVLGGVDIYIRFISGGVYKYSRVPLNTAGAFMTAKSKGHYLATVIKTLYKGERVGD